MLVIMEKKVVKDFMNTRNKQRLIVIIQFCVIFFLSSCKDKGGQILQDAMPLPQPFNFVINVDLPAYQDLAFTNHLYINGYGLKGLVVVKLEDSQYAVYERNCPVNREESCSIVDFVNLGTSGSFLKCQCGEAFYRASDGFPTNSPEPRKLREYYSEFSGNTLYVDSSIL
jgi:hypothetical protein